MRATDAELAYQSQDVLQTLKGRLPTWQELTAIQMERGYDVALTVYYRSILQAQPHSAFIRHVQSTRPGLHDFKKGDAPIEVVIVPSTMPDANQKWGAQAEWMRKVAREMGFSTEIVDTYPGESVAGNARLIDGHLKSTSAKQIILLTTGRGTAEMRFLLSRKNKDAPELRKIKAWVNINGCAQGSQLVGESFEGGAWGEKKAQFKSWLRGEKLASRLELMPDVPFLKEALRAPERMMIVSVFGLLYSDQLEMTSHGRRMKSYGIGDGLLLAQESILRPGLLIPVPGLKHELDEFAVQGLLQRLLTTLGATIQKNALQTNRAALPLSSLHEAEF